MTQGLIAKKAADGAVGPTASASEESFEAVWKARGYGVVADDGTWKTEPVEPDENAPHRRRRSAAEKG